MSRQTKRNSAPAKPAVRPVKAVTRRSGAGAGPAFRISDATPIYVRLILHFRQKIETGEWAVGERIPVLEDLAAELGVARATIRQAMGFLEREGLISRSRRRGTFVLRKPEQDIWYNIPNNWADLAKAAETMEDDTVALDASIPSLTQPGSSNGQWSEDYEVIRQVLKRDHVPYLIGTSYTHKRIVDKLGKDARKRALLYRFIWQSRALRLSHTEQSLTIGMADAEVAYLLEIPLNAPVGIVLRSVFDRNGVVVYHSEGIFRGDFIRVHRRLK